LKTTPEIIREAESRWYQPLYRHCEGLFSGIFLPSHDHLHHARVWSHARSLIILLDKAGARIPASLPEELLVAVFFHDAGLVRTSDEWHGRESRRLCEEFFSQPGAGAPPGSPIPGKTSLRRILHAVEHHDDKSLKGAGPEIRPGDVPGLLSLLSSADDLDAFGRIGIYRYAEIYLMRGIGTEQLPRKVAENVKNRFDNLQNTYALLEDFIRIQEQRFLRVYDFYLRLSQACAEGDENPSWESQLISMILDSIRERKNLLQKDRELPRTGFDAETGDWFRALDRELQMFR
jgi:hypothetical protein